MTCVQVKDNRLIFSSQLTADQGSEKKDANHFLLCKKNTSNIGGGGGVVDGIFNSSNSSDAKGDK